MNDHWKYSKNESLQPEQLQEFTHLLVEAKSKYSSSLKVFTHTHVILDSVETFAQISINTKIIPPIKIKTKPAIFILERKDFREFPRDKSQMIDADVVEDSESSQTSAEEKDDFSIDVDRNEKIEDLPVVQFEAEDKLFEQQLETEQVIEIEEPGVTDELKEPTFYEEEPTKENDVKKAVDDMKALRKERKQKAIAKIKSETRKQVVASAKEKLRELMKRHKDIAKELAEAKPSDDDQSELDTKEIDGRGDIPETEDVEASANLDAQEDEVLEEVIESQVETPVEKIAQSSSDIVNSTNERIDDIVEEVIQRLIDRKIYDDKTKLEDIKPEDRQVIQQIVEEVLAERMNYTNTDSVQQEL